MTLTVTILGCGSSSGVPEIGCECAVCTSNKPKNIRTRCSILLKQNDKFILIDTSPDFRYQALRQGLNRLDGVLYTHEHADHIQGIDDLRQINTRMNDSIDAYADARTTATLQLKFDYIFQPPPTRAWYRPSVNLHTIEPLTRFTVAGIEILPIEQQHADITSLGFRIGNFAYSTDVNGFSEESFAALEGLDVWIVDCLRYQDSFTHSKLSMTLEWIERLKPKKAILTHMAHELDYDILCNELPANVTAGYDGLTIEVNA